jgi:L-fuculose-phosphate aldolase
MEANCSALREAVANCIGASLPQADPPRDPRAFFNSAACRPLKAEVIRSGYKLWERQYVEGNGGNLSARISPRHVLCTPTMLSKADVGERDLCLVNLDNERIEGHLRQTSEIRLHLEIYKALPHARAVIHCHPPHATAYAVAGLIPQGNLLPEQEVFVGSPAISPYETPGTQAFAETVLPYVRTHNAILLTHHGVVCWADTPTHAEWYVEILETYCRTIMLARQLTPNLTEFAPAKVAELLQMKKGLGLPDERFGEAPSPALAAAPAEDLVFADLLQGQDGRPLFAAPEEVERLTESIVARVREFIRESLVERQ